MTYAYARVSSADQNEARQLDAFRAAGIPSASIYTDHASGKDFARPAYRRLRSTLRHGDLLVIHSLDRLGRDYDAILEEWRYLTKTVGVDIRVLNMPILDTTQGMGLIGRFIGDVVLQLLSFVAEMERKNIKERQAQGIKSARARGVRFGRPSLNVPATAGRCLRLVRRGKLTLDAAASQLGVSRTTVHRWAKEGV